MLNRVNFIGWSNLAIRLLLGLGLVFLVQYRYGDAHVKSWLVYITLISLIQASDGLVSQYFVREFLRERANGRPLNLSHCRRLQRNIYLVLGVAFSSIGTISLIDEMAADLFVPLFIFSALKVFDSRARAELDIYAFQKLEFAINLGFAVILGVAFVCFKEYAWIPCAHVFGLVLGLIVKAQVSKIGRKKQVCSWDSLVVEGGKSDGLWQSIIIAFGGGLSVNLALLALQSWLGADITASYLFTFRIAALICEIASVPLIIRVPTITRHIAEGNSYFAFLVFRKNYTVALGAAALGFASINLVATYWNEIMPSGLHLETGLLLAVISVAWILERAATLRAQMQLSLKDYASVPAYLLYCGMVSAGVLIATSVRSPAVFSWALLVSNMVVVALVVVGRGETHVK